MKTLALPALRPGEAFAQIRDFARAPIDNFPWDRGGFCPESEARAAYRPGEALYVQLASREGAHQPLRAECRTAGGPVYKDSCLECFVDFAPGSAPGYLNFEFNPRGVLHLGLGAGRAGRRPVNPARFSLFGVASDRDLDPEGRPAAGWWRIRFRVPAAFLRDCCGLPDALRRGRELRGNFYKCGDETRHAHYGMWGDCAGAAPDFHRPEYFGRLVLD